MASLIKNSDVEDKQNPLPPNMQAMVVELTQTREQVLAYSKQADGLIFNLVGVDGILALIPVVGGVYSAGGGFYLLSKAFKAKCNIGTILLGCALVAVDVVVGVIVGFGDVVDICFRSHAIFAEKIIDEVDRKLNILHSYYNHGLANGMLTQPEIVKLEDEVLRGGQTKAASLFKVVVIALIAVFVLHSCIEQQKERQRNIEACKVRGEWFCSFKY